MPPSSAGEEIQSEFFVEYNLLIAAVKELYKHAAEFRDHVQITEIRGVTRDDIPFSPAKERRVFGIHFTWKHDFENVYYASQRVQEILKPFKYGVHWGKFFHTKPEIYDFYAGDIEQLKELIGSKNGSHKFTNCWIERHMLGNDNC